MIFFGISAFKIWKEVFKGEKPNIVGPAVATGPGAAGEQKTVEPSVAAERIGQVDADTKDLEKGPPSPRIRSMRNRNSTRECLCTEYLLLICSSYLNGAAFARSIFCSVVLGGYDPPISVTYRCNGIALSIGHIAGTELLAMQPLFVFRLQEGARLAEIVSRCWIARVCNVFCMHLGLSLLSPSFSVSCRCAASPHLAHEGLSWTA